MILVDLKQNQSKYLKTEKRSPANKVFIWLTDKERNNELQDRVGETEVEKC